MMRLESYKYEPLTEADAFRLILLQPAESNKEDLRCNLLHTTLSQCDRDIIDHYVALSYVWGDATKTGLIFVDGITKTITASLETALRDARDTRRVLRIWADALCIDQSNLAERSSQVGLMTQIYATAQHTVIYLGPLTDSAEAVLTAAPSNISTSVVKARTSTSYSTNTKGDDLLQLPWFSRVWIFQELVKSRDPWVQCGPLRSRWAEFCSILLSPNQGYDGKRIRMLEEMNRSQSRSQGTLFSLLMARRGLGATDPRDMIYAHIGIASDRYQVLNYIQVDYERQDLVSVYEQAAKYIIETVGPGKLFPQLEDRNLEKATDGLASWAPDWRLASPASIPMTSSGAVGHRRTPAKPHLVFACNPLMLAHIGYEVDTISSMSLVLPDPKQLNAANRDYYQQVVRDLEAMYRTGSGVWWSGDVNGQYRHVNLTGREAEHERLCGAIVQEWQHIFSHELASLQTIASSLADLESHSRFVEQFRQWHNNLAGQEIIMVGSDSDNIEGLMYKYLLSKSIPSELTGRRMAITKAGRVAIVPRHAQSGDVVAYIVGSFVSLVIRKGSQPTNPNWQNEITQAFAASVEQTSNNSYGEILPPAIEVNGMPMESYALVGECYLNGEEGWKKKVDKEPQLKILVLR